MGREDPDVADEMQRLLGDEGIRFLIATETRDVRGRSGEEVEVNVRTAAGEHKLNGSDILVAAGRIPNTPGIGLEEAGLSWMVMATFASMNGWRRRRLMSGQ